MSMRVGDESARTHAESLDSALASNELPTPRGRGEWRRAGRRFVHHVPAMVGLGFLALMAFACFVLVRSSMSS